MADGNTCSVDGCTRAVKARGWCKMHYNRWHRLGSVDGSGRLSTSERFWAKVDKTDGCWLWTASLDRDGYGRFYGGDRMVGAHRWAYEAEGLSIPDGLQLDHLCRVRHCVNPAHLEPVTNEENMRRSPIHYWARACCIRGHEFSPENTHMTPDGHRQCIACRREHDRKWKAKRRADIRLRRSPNSASASPDRQVPEQASG